MIRDDTIVAISTPPGRGGIGVLRLSGARSLALATSIFRAAAPPITPHRAQFGHVVDTSRQENSAIIDEAVLTYFQAPRSYTGEDVVELSCHGSPVILHSVLTLLVEQGARIAEPGEFTLRAFLNRKIDLAQAQAVRDLINAQTAYQARVATRQLEGAFSQRLTPRKQELLTIIVHMESAVEFVEDDIAPDQRSTILQTLDRLIADLQAVAATFTLGRFVREGFDLAIVGRPNVGKSSVFNQLVGSERAIVTAIPGTTRDALYESASIAGLPVRLIDTAGIRDTEDVVESIGIRRSRTAMADADIVLLVLDNSDVLQPDDERLLNEVPEAQRIIALNKSDLGQRLAERETDAVSISALTGVGLEDLQAKIFQRLSGNESVEREDVLITDARQQQAVSQALAQLKEARTLLGEGELEEIILLKLHAALNALGEVTGETVTDDILGQIFSTFCVGK